MPFLGGSCRVAVSMSSKGMLLFFRKYTEGTLVAINIEVVHDDNVHSESTFG